MAIDREAFRAAAKVKPAFTAEQGAAALERQELGPVVAWDEVGANPTNCVYRAATPDIHYIVKIKFRGTTSRVRPGASLRVERDMVEWLRSVADLPVSDVCLLDEETESFGYPYLISQVLPGINGRDYFTADTMSDTQRVQLLKAFGRIVAAINGLSVPKGLLPVRDMARWKEDISQRLLDNTALIEVLPPECQDRLPTIGDLLARVDVALEDVPQGVLWGDAALHNINVDEAGRIVGVYDFEDGAVGDLWSEQLHIAAECTRSPKEIYGQPHYPGELWGGYAEAGGVYEEPGATYMQVRQATMGAGLCWFWEVLGVLHPRTPEWLADLEAGLRKLAAR